MTKLDQIVVFEDDYYFLALLKGYCYGVNIGMKTFVYDLNGITETEKLRPALIAVPLESVLAPKNRALTDRLKAWSEQGWGKVVVLNKDSACYSNSGFLDWADAVIETPYDIREFDTYLRSAWLSQRTAETEGTSAPEKRSGTDRRQQKINSHGEIIYCDRRMNNDRRSCYERRNTGLDHPPKVPDGPAFKIDHRNKCLYLKGQKIELTPKEFELLLLLSTDVERIFTPDEIVNHLWPESHRATKSDLYQYMHLLRKKIENGPDSPQWIKNVKGFGYKLELSHS